MARRPRDAPAVRDAGRAIAQPVTACGRQRPTRACRSGTAGDLPLLAPGGRARVRGRSVGRGGDPVRRPTPLGGVESFGLRQRPEYRSGLVPCRAAPVADRRPRRPGADRLHRVGPKRKGGRDALAPPRRQIGQPGVALRSGRSGPGRGQPAPAAGRLARRPLGRRGQEYPRPADLETRGSIVHVEGDGGHGFRVS